MIYFYITPFSFLGVRDKGRYDTKKTNHSVDNIQVGFLLQC